MTDARASTLIPRVMIVAFAALPVAVAAWAFAPLRAPALSPPTEPTPHTPISPTTSDLAVFSSPLWMAPPAPPPPPAPEAPLPPLRIELLAIIRNDGPPRAIVYDMDADRITAVSAGDALGRATIERVGETDITIIDPAGSRTVAFTKPGGST